MWGGEVYLLSNFMVWCTGSKLPLGPQMETSHATLVPHIKGSIFGQLGIRPKCDSAFHLIRIGLLECMDSAWI